MVQRRPATGYHDGAVVAAESDLLRLRVQSPADHVALHAGIRPELVPQRALRTGAGADERRLLHLRPRRYWRRGELVVRRIRFPVGRPYGRVHVEERDESTG